MVGAMVSQLVKDVPPEELEKWGYGPIYAIHGRGVYPSDSNGVPFTAAYIESMSDPIANLNEDLAAEQKARATYEYLINMADDPDVIDPLRFLREREVVHYQRFGETLRIVQELLGKRKFWPNDKPYRTGTLGAQDMMRPNTNMRPEAIMPEMTKPNTNMRPEAMMPEMTKPNTNMRPEAIMPEVTKPAKNMMPEAAKPEAIKPVKKPDIIMPDMYMHDMMNMPMMPTQTNKNPNPIAPFTNMKK